MLNTINRISDYLARNKGLPIFLGVLLVILNYVAQFFIRVPVLGFIAGTNLLLHLGVIMALIGILIGDAL
jgi:hypothetical protein